MYLIQINKKLIKPLFEATQMIGLVPMLFIGIGLKEWIDMLVERKEVMQRIEERMRRGGERILTVWYMWASHAWSLGWYLGEGLFVLLGKKLDGVPLGSVLGNLENGTPSWRLKPYGADDVWTRRLYRLARIPTLFAFQLPLLAAGLGITIALAVAAMPVGATVLVLGSIGINVIGLIGTVIEGVHRLIKAVQSCFNACAGYPEPGLLENRVAERVRADLANANQYALPVQEPEEPDVPVVPLQPPQPVINVGLIQRRLDLLKNSSPDETMGVPKIKAFLDDEGRELQDPHVLPCNHVVSAEKLQDLRPQSEGVANDNPPCFCPNCQQPFNLKSAVKDFSLATAITEFGEWKKAWQAPAEGNELDLAPESEEAFEVKFES